MRAPEFWWQPAPTLAAMMLAPAGYVWGTISAQRMNRTGAEAEVPVLCIGNFVAGGAGKTPVAMACARILQRSGYKPAFLSRGYGGSFAQGKRSVHVDLNKHSALEAGDEPMLLARIAATFVCADRLTSANAATAMGADVLIMDDGLQNPSLDKTCSIAVADGQSGIGNGLCIPAGPLRAPLHVQLPKVNALIVIGDGAAGDDLAALVTAHGKPAFRAVLQPDAEAAAQVRGRKVVAFAGIGRPAKFFATLEEAGAVLAEAFAFGDHHTLDANEISTLQQAARAHDALLVTTEKDFARVGDSFGSDAPAVLPVTLALDDAAAFSRFLLRQLARK